MAQSSPKRFANHWTLPPGILDFFTRPQQLFSYCFWQRLQLHVYYIFILKEGHYQLVTSTMYVTPFQEMYIKFGGGSVKEFAQEPCSEINHAIENKVILKSVISYQDELL